VEKKSGYKYQIEQELNKRNWEVVEIASDTDWWDDEHWKVQFLYDPTISFYVCFIVDPQFEGLRKKGQGIYEINASLNLPKNWNDETSQISCLSMTKRKFEIKLNAFIAEIEAFKKAKANHKT
jgi:hypothetical protein